MINNLFLRRIVFGLMPLLYFGITVCGFSFDEPLSFEKFLSLVRDPQIRQLSNWEQKFISAYIEPNKIMFIPTPAVKKLLRVKENVPESILNALSSNFASRIEYQMYKFRCDDCQNPNLFVCNFMYEMKRSLQQTIAKLSADTPEIWYGKGVNNQIIGCNSDQIREASRLVVDVKGELRQNAQGYKVIVSLYQRLSNSGSLYLGEFTVDCPSKRRQDTQRTAEFLGYSIKSYIEDAFVKTQ